ncbi:UDP binding domain-containing protein [Clostridium novyi]|nr:UDP binding domain-containing protein [Clostridium novyi]
MKDYSNDDRISPPIDICKLLLERGANVEAFDPVVPTSYDFKVDTQDEALKGADAVLILTKQHAINFNYCEHMSNIMKDKPVCIDTKAVISQVEAEKYGIRCWRI